jgi:hypothetical protein
MNRRGFFKAMLASAAAIVAAPVLKLWPKAKPSITTGLGFNFYDLRAPLIQSRITLEELQRTLAKIDALPGLCVERDYYVIDWPMDVPGTRWKHDPAWLVRQDIAREERRHRVQVKWNARRLARIKLRAWPYSFEGPPSPEDARFLVDLARKYDGVSIEWRRNDS